MTLSPEVEKLFKTFANRANKARVISHPHDRKRWYAFIVEAHKESETIDPRFLQSALIQHGWSEEAAIEISLRYEDSRELLKYYDEH